MARLPDDPDELRAQLRTKLILMDDPELPADKAPAKPTAEQSAPLFGGTGNTFNVCLGGTINQYGQAGERSAS